VSDYRLIGASSLMLTERLVILTTINYIMKKIPQPTKGQRYDRLKQKRIFQTSWKENIPWVEASGRQITPAI
jgi:hypothetical protein